ncbi:MAG: hypothetical protein O2782_11835 [bacterium]|nr:hypothetical protein [bacterium]
MTVHATIEVEEDLCTYQSADNGAGPLWCHGSTIVARSADRVFVAALETLADQVPLNNTRWVLYERPDNGAWRLLHTDTTGRTREPSPIALVGNDLLVSANPTLTAAGAYNGPAQPTVFRFDTRALDRAPCVEPPDWEDSARFSEHSYRTVAADGATGDVLYMQNEGYEIAHMSLRRGGVWQPRGEIRWPFGDEYARPQPLRLCYPNVMLCGGGAHFLGVGDIIEPVEPWREAKKQITGRDWDYVFRRLFHARTPDLGSQPFGPWLELANRDATAGSTRHCDLWIDATGDAHILWIESSTDARLRDQFFPDTQIRQSLEYAIVRAGQCVERHCLATHSEGDDGLIPSQARLHVAASGVPLILAQFHDARGVRWRLAPLQVDPAWIDVAFRRPMSGTFLTNTVRGGSAPADVIDIVSSIDGPGLGYARLRVEV